MFAFELEQPPTNQRPTTARRPNPQVGDFGLSIRIDPGATHISNLFQGTMTHMVRAPSRPHAAAGRPLNRTGGPSRAACTARPYPLSRSPINLNPSNPNLNPSNPNPKPSNPNPKPSNPNPKPSNLTSTPPQTPNPSNPLNPPRPPKPSTWAASPAPLTSTPLASCSTSSTRGGQRSRGWPRRCWGTRWCGSTGGQVRGFVGVRGGAGWGLRVGCLLLCSRWSRSFFVLNQTPPTPLQPQLNTPPPTPTPTPLPPFNPNPNPSLPPHLPL